MAVWLCMAATLRVIPGLSIDVAQWGKYAYVVYCNSEGVSRARKAGLVSQYTTMSMLIMKRGD